MIANESDFSFVMTTDFEKDRKMMTLMSCVSPERLVVPVRGAETLSNKSCLEYSVVFI